jgi:hypothetical protein
MESFKKPAFHTTPTHPMLHVVVFSRLLNIEMEKSNLLIELYVSWNHTLLNGLTENIYANVATTSCGEFSLTQV